MTNVARPLAKKDLVTTSKNAKRPQHNREAFKRLPKVSFLSFEPQIGHGLYRLCRSGVCSCISLSSTPCCTLRYSESSSSQSGRSHPTLGTLSNGLWELGNILVGCLKVLPDQQLLIRKLSQSSSRLPRTSPRPSLTRLSVLTKREKSSSWYKT